MLGLHCCTGFSLVVAGGLLISVASRCGAWALGLTASVVAALWLWSADSMVVLHVGLSCSVACRILVPPPGIKPTPLHWKCRALITGPPGKLLFECLTRHSCRARPCEHLNLKLNSILHTYGRRRWHPTPVLLPGKSNGWRSLVGCSPWGR